MPLFNLDQEYEWPEKPEVKKTFQDFVTEDIDNVFFNFTEHAELREVDGREMPVIVEDGRVKPHSAHWEAGAKQNFDTGLYEAYTILYVRVKDYGKKPKIGKYLSLDGGERRLKTFAIRDCEDERGVYRIKMQRIRQ